MNDSSNSKSHGALDVAQRGPTGPSRQGFLSSSLSFLPSAIVLILIAGLAFWAHAHEWKMPKFSALFASGEEEEKDWCELHSVPQSICVECEKNKDLFPRLESVWCPIHGIHDCPLDHPEIAQLPAPPKITAEDFARAKRALDLKPRPVNDEKSAIHKRRIQFESQEAFEKLDIKTQPATLAPVAETIVANGEITFAQPLISPVSTPVAGRIWHVSALGQLGANVRRGDMLALVDAAEVGKAKSEFLQAYAQLDLRTKTLENIRPAVNQGAIPYARLAELEAEQREAQIHLVAAQQSLMNLGLPIQIEAVKGMSTDDLSRYMQFFGIPKTIADQLDAKTSSGNLFPVLAPRDGVITAVKVAAGEMADSSRTLFVITDTSQMWLVLNVRNEDVPYLRIRGAAPSSSGQMVHFRADGAAGEINAELVWKNTQIDEKTRTVQVRAQVPNPNGDLLANMFGTGRIVIRAEDKAIVVPSEAVHWDGECHVVFVRDKNFEKKGAYKVFHVRTVRLGARDNNGIEIIAGLLPGEVVATRNSSFLRAELLKGNLGEGES